MPPPTPRGKFTPHKVMREAWTYFSVEDSDIVIGIKTVVTKVIRLEGPDGQPLNNPDGTPSYFWNSFNVVRTLTAAEWEIQRKSLESE